ncbi:MAG: hypothetical protein AAF481_15955 [Acidobacteriota bacterium]
MTEPIVSPWREDLPEIDSADLERRRRLPESLLEALRRHGFLRLVIPRRYGGREGDLRFVIDRLCDLAQRDASTAWNVMVWVQGQIVLARLPLATYERVLANGPDVPVAATAVGSGRLRPEGQGLRLTGRWSLTSGITHSRWVLVHCDLDDGESSRMVGALLPREAVEVEDVWHVLGLRATGSNVIHARKVRLAHTDLYDLDGDICATATAHSRLPIRPSFSLHQGAVALGTAEGAVADLLAQFADKGVAPGGDGDRQALLRLELGTHRADLDAAKATLLSYADTAWERASQHQPLEEKTHHGMWAAGAHGVRVASEVVQWCFRMSGPAGLYDGHPLQRRLRDMFTIAQHGNVAPSHSASLGGALLAGE